jgi:hypothetical protein
MICRAGWVLLLVAIVVCFGVLSLCPSHAAPAAGGQSAANPAEQRMEMIAELREIKALLKEQNALLQSGNLKVVVTEPQKR